MTANTKIEWADHTFNPWIGCTKVAPGCDHCYAEAWAARFKRATWGAGKPRVLTSADTWRQALKWNAEAARTGQRPRVFCASLADVFDNDVPPQWRWNLFKLIAATPCLDWLLLTKRIGNARDNVNTAASFVADTLGNNAWDLRQWPNVWIGATIVNQEEADRDIPKLLATPATKRFLSIEPMLGPVDVVQWLGPRQRPNHDGYGGDHGPGWTTDFTRIDWVIVGGESGPHARPMHPDWARSLRDQCTGAGVPFFFKQWGEWWEAASEVRDEPTGGHRRVTVPSREADDTLDPNTDCLVAADGRVFRSLDALLPMVPGRLMTRVGKKAAGRLLDGRTWDEVPG